MGQALLEVSRSAGGLEQVVAAAEVAGEGTCAYRLDRERRVLAVRDRQLLAVRDRQLRTVYVLGAKPDGGFGWMGAYEEPHGWVWQTWKLRAAEPMAAVRELGGEQEVAELTLAAASLLEDGGADERAAARRLRREVAAGHDQELMAVRAIQAAVLRCQVEQGLTISDLCHRGGFLGADGRPEVSWLERRAGLKPEVCSRTGRRRHRRVVDYRVFVRLVEAVGGAPVDFGA